ncbi:MAG: C1 family peptidase [Oligoflexales bacterium]
MKINLAILIFFFTSHSIARDLSLPSTVLIDPNKELTAQYLARSIAANGVSPIRFNQQVDPDMLHTSHELDPGKTQNQKQSGRCWIFAGEKILGEVIRDAWDKELTFSHNYIAFWDKMERANYILEKLFEYRQLKPNDPKIQSLINHMGDGGEWELFKNIVKKYGVVPVSVMPETSFSGNSRAYTQTLSQVIARSAGLILQLNTQYGKETIEQEFIKIKSKSLRIIRTILVNYLGTPPQFYSKHQGKFYWQQPKDKKSKTSDEKTRTEGEENIKKETKENKNEVKNEGKVENIVEKLELISPIDLLDRAGIKLDDYVHISHLPYHKDDKGKLIEGYELIVKDGGNVIDMEPLKTLLVNMSEIKTSIRKSIKDGSGVQIGCEMKHLDIDKSLLSISNDEMSTIFEIDTLDHLDKADRMLAGEDKVAHGMYLIGCDDADKTLVNRENSEAKDIEFYGPLWKVLNSWGNGRAEKIFMTDQWFEEYAHSFILKKKYLSQSILDSLSSGLSIETDYNDPFSKITAKRTN